MPSNYTAILSVHGIGRHRRYANAGALLSALEAVAGSNNTSSSNTIIEVRPGIERPNIDDFCTDVPMLQLRRARRNHGKLTVGSIFRVYEVNWSPETREPMPVRTMSKWTLSLLWSIFRFEPKSWLEWPQLRMARLRLAAETTPQPAVRHALAVMASAYRKYRGSLGVNHRMLKGDKPDFDDFVIFAKSHARGAVTESHINAGAEAWQSTTLPSEKSVRRSGQTALTGIMLFSLIIISVFLTLFSDHNLGSFLYKSVSIFLATIAVLLIVFLGRFLTTIFSDVRYWSALNENDRLHSTRNAVLDKTTAMIRHLVADPTCVRVVIISHSLGTAIAYDALRAIGLFNRARADIPVEQINIRKVECLITLGSPIDKLALLFETTGGHNFREELMREELRGDLNTNPFWVKDKQRVKWLNFWDPADPVSDALYTPLGAKPLGDRFQKTSIENIMVHNTSVFEPAKSHTGYLSNPAVASRIFNEIFRPEQPAIGKNLDYTKSRQWSRWLILTLVVGITGLLLTFIAAHFLPMTWFLKIFLWLGFVSVVVSLLGLVALATSRS